MDISHSQRRILALSGAALLSVVLLISLAIPLWGRYVANDIQPQALQPFPTLPVPEAGTVIDPPRPMSDWTLTSHTGAPLRLSDLRGKAVLLFFGYTSCPDFCPTTLADFAQIKKALGSAGDQLAVVFISVDSERDTPERLARYVTSFDKSFIAATSDDATLRQMGREYGLFFERSQSSGDHSGHRMINHSTASYLLDSEGRQRIIYSYNTPPEVITTDVRALLQP